LFLYIIRVGFSFKNLWCCKKKLKSSAFWLYGLITLLVLVLQIGKNLWDLVQIDKSNEAFLLHNWNQERCKWIKVKTLPNKIGLSTKQKVVKSEPNLRVDMFHCLQVELKQTTMALYLRMLMSKKLELLFRVHGCESWSMFYIPYLIQNPISFYFHSLQSLGY
jgi:hypothetical protein